MTFLNLIRRACVVAVLGMTTLPAASIEPATWQQIAAAVAAYFQSQEGQCQVHACNCDGCNQGAKNRCHEIARRIREFKDTPNDYNASQVYDITGSKRTVCMAQRMMGDTNWAVFNSYRGR